MAYYARDTHTHTVAATRYFPPLQPSDSRAHTQQPAGRIIFFFLSLHRRIDLPAPGRHNTARHGRRVTRLSAPPTERVPRRLPTPFIHLYTYYDVVLQPFLCAFLFCRQQAIAPASQHARSSSSSSHGRFFARTRIYTYKI